MGLHEGHPADARRDQLRARLKLKNGSLEVEKATSRTVGWPVRARRVRQTGTSGPCQSGAKDRVSLGSMWRKPLLPNGDHNSPSHGDAVAKSRRVWVQYRVFQYACSPMGSRGFSGFVTQFVLGELETMNCLRRLC